MQNKISSSKKVLFGILLIFSISSYTHSNECSFSLSPWIAVSIDVTTCKADTLENLHIHAIDLDTIQGNIVYGEGHGCPLSKCLFCGCGSSFFGKDTLYGIFDLEVIKANDSIDFNDTNQVEKVSNLHDYIPLFTPFAYKNGDTLAVCWVTNHNPPISIGGGPKAGIIHCISRTDNISKIDYSSINPGKPVSIHKEKKRIRLKKTDYKLYDLLGRSAKNPLRM